MAWTVPSGCYYASSTEVPNYKYWSAGQSVTAQYVPNIDNHYGFILVDFTNGYIYGDIANVTINISANKTFTLTNKTSSYITLPNVFLMASSDALSARTISLSGSEFAFGDGSGILNKGAFMSNGVDYSMNKAFKGRTDITNVTLPNGVGLFESCFEGCNSLQTVSGTISELKGAYKMFYGCTALTSAPTFQSVYTGTIYSSDTAYPNSFMYCFYNCASLVTAPTFPQTLNSNTDFRWCFYNCVSLTTPPVLAVGATKLDSCFRGCSSLEITPEVPSSATSLDYAFYGCTSLTTAPTLPESITSIANCFFNCTSLTIIPTLPSALTAMQGAFQNCSSLVTAPTIPENVTNLQGCFQNCTSMTTVSTVPSSVTNAERCFKGCTLLTGDITIDASPTNITDMFLNTVEEIVLFGTGGMNETLVAEYTNLYFWSLASTITAQRATSPTTTVNISVDVSRFNSGTLSSLDLYRGTSTTPLSVTWNDPTLTITGTNATFTTTLTNIGESETFTLTAIATDTYGSSQASSVKIPVSFYTMDVQAGGKEIAFGSLADDDVTLHPNGLFKCSMDALFEGDVVIGGGGISGTPIPTADTVAEFDDDARMNSTDMTSQEVEDFVDGLNVSGVTAVDYIVEQDTSGGWTYRKWNSGVAEAWKRTGSTSYAMTNTVGSNGYTSDYWTLPSGLFTSVTSASVNRINGGNGLVSCSVYSMTTSRLDHYIWVTGATGTVTMELSLEVKGTWK